MSQLILIEERLQSINDCVVKFANVNGSGSASANHLFAKAVYRMGIPVSPRNIFPSNIQGLPTWYEVRISEKGYTARKEGADIMIAMNAQTLSNDIQSINPGGYLLYDSTKQLPPNLLRSDINIIGIPFTRLCIDAFGDVKARHLFKNICYVGALAALMDMELSVLTEMLNDQFRGKEKLIKPNVEALTLGYEYIKSYTPHPLGIRLQECDAVGDKILMDGNTATALGCLYGGATVVGWYPITPSTSVVDNFVKYAEQLRVDKKTGLKKFAIAQAEDELAAIGMVIGANWNGARAFTATSGPGISLMSEFLGLAYFAEVPTVLINVQRGGPSTGMPTRTQQSDLITCAYASHGDTRHVLLFPSHPKECFDMGADAFDYAEQLQTPIIIMSDLDLGMNDWLSQPLEWDDKRRYKRGKVMSAEELEKTEAWGRYVDIDEDGICYRTLPGTHPTKGAYFTRGTSRDRYATYSEDSDVYIDNMQRLERKFETAKSILPRPEINKASTTSRYGAIYYGTTAPAMEEARDLLGTEGIALDLLKVRAFPFHDSVLEFINDYENVFVVEQNRDGQLRSLIIDQGEINPAKLKSIVYYGGMPITASMIKTKIENWVNADKPATPTLVNENILQQGAR